MERRAFRLRAASRITARDPLARRRTANLIPRKPSGSEQRPRITPRDPQPRKRTANLIPRKPSRPEQRPRITPRDPQPRKRALRSVADLDVDRDLGVRI